MLTVAGAATLTLGGGALAVMGAGLGVGRSADARTDALVDRYGSGPCGDVGCACLNGWCRMGGECRFEECVPFTGMVRRP